MIDIYNAPEKTVMVICHTAFGDTIDQHGRYYEVGKEYKMTTSIYESNAGTNNQECILCWINHSVGYGSRFAVKGNVYRYDEPYWPDFKDYSADAESAMHYFICPVARVRDDKLDEIGI